MKLFNRFADLSERAVASATFFVLCVLLIVIWAPTIVFFPLDTWQLIINTVTTIVTFLLVALLTNSQHRFENRVETRQLELLGRVEAIQRRLEEVADR